MPSDRLIFWSVVPGPFPARIAAEVDVLQSQKCQRVSHISVTIQVEVDDLEKSDQVGQKWKILFLEETSLHRNFQMLTSHPSLSKWSNPRCAPYNTGGYHADCSNRARVPLVLFCSILQETMGILVALRIRLGMEY